MRVTKHLLLGTMIITAVMPFVVKQAQAFDVWSFSEIRQSVAQFSETEGLFQVVSETEADAKLAKGAQNFIDNMGSRALGFLANDSLTAEKKSSEFRNLLEDSFDMRTIARFALGRYWRTASDSQRNEYVKLFNKMVIEVYTQRFDEYSGQKFSVVSARPEGKKDAVVTSVISSPSGPDVQVDWRVRYKNNRYQIVDVVVEGVSMSLTQRSEFSTVIQRGGGDIEVLLTHLKSRG